MYIGSKEIQSEIELGDGKIQYTLTDNSGDIVTKEQYESMLKEQAYDDKLVRVKKWSPAVKQIMEILLKNDMKLIEKDFVSGRVDETIIGNYGMASAKLFGADHEGNITLSQIDKALTKKENIMSEEIKVETPISGEVASPVEPIVETPGSDVSAEVPASETPVV